MSEHPPSAKKKHWRWVLFAAIVAAILIFTHGFPNLGKDSSVPCRERTLIELGGHIFEVPHVGVALHIDPSSAKLNGCQKAGAAPIKATGFSLFAHELEKNMKIEIYTKSQ